MTTTTTPIALTSESIIFTIPEGVAAITVHLEYTDANATPIPGGIAFFESYERTAEQVNGVLELAEFRLPQFGINNDDPTFGGRRKNFFPYGVTGMRMKILGAPAPTIPVGATHWRLKVSS